MTFWILLAVKCPIENYSKPYGYAKAMPQAWGLKGVIGLLTEKRDYCIMRHNLCLFLVKENHSVSIIDT